MSDKKGYGQDAFGPKQNSTSKPYTKNGRVTRKSNAGYVAHESKGSKGSTRSK